VVYRRFYVRRIHISVTDNLVFRYRKILMQSYQKGDQPERNFYLNVRRFGREL
jgi:hypothetical protein